MTIKTIKKYSLFSFMGLAVVALSGCTNFPIAFQHGGNPLTQPWNYADAQSLSSSDHSFKEALVGEYKALATKEGVTWSDWFDSDFFSRKALLAAKSEAGVDPEDPALWRFKQKDIDRLRAARNELMAALETGRSRFPGLAARAQGRYDCWVEEEEEAWQADEIAKCKGEFEAALSELKGAQATNSAPPVAKSKMVDKPSLYTVFFDFDSTVVTPVGTQVLQAVVDDWGTANVTLSLVGHADRAGTTAYNQKLSERRALSVAKTLTGFGLAPERTAKSGLGENDPAVPTADGVREARNRRVVIAVTK